MGDHGQRHIPGREYENDGDRARQRAPRVGRRSGGDRRIARAPGRRCPRRTTRPRLSTSAPKPAGRSPGRVVATNGWAMSLYSTRRVSKRIHTDGQWTLDELEQLVPASLAAGLTNPAPAESPRQAGT